ncbi:MAG: alpha-L-fucosidase [Bacteroidota bacterium]|nr:alpha-L-fucosidase [Bacteroidota bacterium]
MKKLLTYPLLFFSLATFGQKAVAPPRPLLPIPNQRQLDWMGMEMNAFVHFTINTFTDLEWGNGDEAESVFNPSAPDPVQWATVLKQAGFKGLIFTCKHHDGFCLWPSKYTEHSIKKSPYKNGNGDMVRETSDACKKTGVKFGIYLSPWDRNRADYAKPGYITYYRNQLTELITNYGPIFELWFDGANGGTGYYGGAREKRTISASYYDWPNTVKLARKLQSKEFIIFSDNGPDIRWVGNEEGWVGKTNWYMIDPDSALTRRPGYEKLLGSGMENGSHWIPSEVDVSIRPGWFYHALEDSKVKTPEQLFDIYLNSVGRGAVLLLNVPPDRRGLFHENDVKALQGFRQLIDREFKSNLAAKATITVSSFRGKSRAFDATKLTDNNADTYWATNNNITSGTIMIDLKKEQTIKYVVLHEYLKLGQRVKAFNIEVKKGNDWIKVANETTIGYKRIIKINPVQTDKIRVNITASRGCLTISEIEVF